MSTIFEGEGEIILRRFGGLAPLNFLEMLPLDDLVGEIVDSGAVLIVELTTAVISPLKMLTIFLKKKEGKIILVIRSSEGEDIFFGDLGLGRAPYQYNTELFNPSSAEILFWLRRMNTCNVSDWIKHILEAKEEFESGERVYLPLRFLYCMRQMYPVKKK